MGKRMRFLRRAAFAMSVLRTAQWIASGSAGAFFAGLVGVVVGLSVSGLAFAILAAAGACALITTTVAARLGWRAPRVTFGHPEISDITITETRWPFPGGLLAAQALSGTSSVTTTQGREVSRPAVMVLVPVLNEYVPRRNQAEDLTVHLSCWTLDGSRITREVRARERGAPRKASPVTLPPTGAPIHFDSVCKVIQAADAGLYVDDGFVQDITAQDFTLRAVARGRFKEVRADYRITHGGPNTRISATRVGR